MIDCRYRTINLNRTNCVLIRIFSELRERERQIERGRKRERKIVVRFSFRQENEQMFVFSILTIMFFHH